MPFSALVLAREIELSLSPLGLLVSCLVRVGSRVGSPTLASLLLVFVSRNSKQSYSDAEQRPDTIVQKARSMLIRQTVLDEAATQYGSTVVTK